MQYELKLIEPFYWLEFHTISLTPPNMAAGGSAVGVIEQIRAFSLLHESCMKLQYCTVAWWRHNVKCIFNVSQRPWMPHLAAYDVRKVFQ